MRVTAGLLARLLPPSGDDRPSYAQHLVAQVSAAEIERVAALFQRQLLNQTVDWHSRTAYVVARR